MSTPEPLHIDHGDMLRASTMALAYVGGDTAGVNHQLQQSGRADRMTEAIVATMELLVTVIRWRMSDADLIGSLAAIAAMHAQGVERDDQGDDDPPTLPPAA